jgi:hypothetical protein
MMHSMIWNCINTDGSRRKLLTSGRRRCFSVRPAVYAEWFPTVLEDTYSVRNLFLERCVRMLMYSILAYVERYVHCNLVTVAFNFRPNQNASSP